MSKYIVRMILVLVLLAFLQVVLFNHLLLFSYFLPIIYLYPLIKMPISSEPWGLTLIAALTGFFIDLMMNTPGLNMAAATLAIFARPRLLRTFVDEDDLYKSDDPNGLISARMMGGVSYLFYLLSISFIHIATIFLLEFFSLKLFPHTLPFIGGSMGITLLIFFIFDALFTPRKRE